LDGSGFRKYFGWEGLEFVESLGCGKALSLKGSILAARLLGGLKKGLRMVVVIGKVLDKGKGLYGRIFMVWEGMLV